MPEMGICEERRVIPGQKSNQTGWREKREIKKCIGRTIIPA